VRRHDASHAGGDGVAEGHQLHRIQAGTVGEDDGELQVRVRLGVAVPGEVLGDGEHAAVLEPLDVRGDQRPGAPRVLAERARVDDGVRRIRVDVGDGGEGEVQAGDAGLGG